TNARSRRRSHEVRERQESRSKRSMSGLQRSMMRVRSVIVPAAISKAMQAERTTRLPHETGGFLLGLRRGASIEVSEFTPQAAQDQADGSSFERIDPEHQRRATKAWVKANGLV